MRLFNGKAKDTRTAKDKRIETLLQAYLAGGISPNDKDELSRLCANEKIRLSPELNNDATWGSRQHAR